MKKEFILLLIMLSQSLITSGQNIQTEAEVNAIEFIENVVNDSKSQDVLLKTPIFVIEGYLIEDFDAVKTAVLNIVKTDIDKIEAISHEKSTQYFEKAKDGIVIITLKKKVKRKWIKYWKTISD